MAPLSLILLFSQVFLALPATFAQQKGANSTQQPSTLPAQPPSPSQTAATIPNVPTTSTMAQTSSSITESDGNGTNNSTTSPVLCGEGQHNCDPTTVCIVKQEGGFSCRCPAGWYWETENATTCAECPSGSRCIDGVLQTCGAGFYSSSSGQTTCTAVPIGYYCMVAEACRAPQPCEVCPAGQYRLGCGGATPGECRDCPDGTYKGETLTANATCTACTSTSEGCLNSTCDTVTGEALGCRVGSCLDGYFETIPEAWPSAWAVTRRVCAACASGHYCVKGTQYDCGPGMWQSQPGRNSCTFVPPGSYCVRNNLEGNFTCDMIKECDAGYRCTDGLRKACGLGKWQNATNQTSCLDIPPGYTCTAQTKEEAETCTAIKVCPAGYRCEMGQAIGCSGAFWANGTGSSQCDPITKGFYCIQNKTEGMASCMAIAVCEPGFQCDGGNKKECGPGFYQNSSQADSCQPIKSGEYCVANATDSVYSCMAVAACPPGHYCQNGQVYPCGLGYFTNQTAQTSCLPVPSGYFCPSQSLNTCTTIDVCPTGFFCVDGVRSPCGPDMYQDRPGQTSCMLVPSGSFCSVGVFPQCRNVSVCRERSSYCLDVDITCNRSTGEATTCPPLACTDGWGSGVNGGPCLPCHTSCQQCVTGNDSNSCFSCRNLTSGLKINGYFRGQPFGQCTDRPSTSAIEQTDGGGGLSGSALVGIVAGSVLGTLTVVVLVGAAVYVRRRRKEAEKNEKNDSFSFGASRPDTSLGSRIQPVDMMMPDLLPDSHGKVKARGDVDIDDTESETFDIEIYDYVFDFRRPLPQWSAPQVAQWLRNMEPAIRACAPLFAQENITGLLLSARSAADLDALLLRLGLRLGDRELIIHRIHKLERRDKRRSSSRTPTTDPNSSQRQGSIPSIAYSSAPSTSVTDTQLNPTVKKNSSGSLGGLDGQSIRGIYDAPQEDGLGGGVGTGGGGNGGRRESESSGIQTEGNGAGKVNANGETRIRKASDPSVDAHGYLAIGSFSRQLPSVSESEGEAVAVLVPPNA